MRRVIVMLCALTALALVISQQLTSTFDAPLDPSSDAIVAGRSPLTSTTAEVGPESRVRVAATPAAPPVEQRSFEEFVAHLVDLGVATWAAVDTDDDATAAELDAATRDEFGLLRQQIEDSDEKALHSLCGLLGEDPTIRAQVHRKVLLTILELGLRARWSRVEYGGSRGPSDRLVTAMLISVEQDEILARELGLGILTDAPFLGAAHETTVLALVERAAVEPFLVEVAGALLRTLWRNLERDGARTTAELASLAMLFADDTNPSRQVAALRHLLTADDGRFADYVVDLIIRRDEREIATQLAMSAATELEPAAALRVLERFASMGAVSTTAAFLMLGQRSPEVLRTAYEQKLADGIAPHVRAELVTGAGFRGAAVELAQLAFDIDPDPQVRTRALFVLAAQASAEVAERTLLNALDDPGFADRPDRIGAVVTALGNLAQSGEVNAVDRIGRRALVHPQLADGDRVRLQELLARYTPR